MRLKADLTLLFVALIWGSAFAAQRCAAAYVGPFLFNGSRFLLGALVILPFMHFRFKLNHKQFFYSALAGVFITGGSVFQQAGLALTTAGNAGFITGMYVIFIPLILIIVFRRRSGWMTWVAALIAVIGMFLLSANGSLTLAPGDLLELVGAVFWASHVILIEYAMSETDALPFAIGQYLTAGVLSLILGLIFDWKTAPGLLPAWWAVAYVGIFSVAVGYTLQVKAQRIAPATDASLIMSMESVFAALFGWLLLGEKLQPLQLAGAGLILLAILLSQFKPKETVLSHHPPNPTRRFPDFSALFTRLSVYCRFLPSVLESGTVSRQWPLFPCQNNLLNRF